MYNNIIDVLLKPLHKQLQEKKLNRKVAYMCTAKLLTRLEQIDK